MMFPSLSLVTLASNPASTLFSFTEYSILLPSVSVSGRFVYTALCSASFLIVFTASFLFETLPFSVRTTSTSFFKLSGVSFHCFVTVMFFVFLVFVNSTASLFAVIPVNLSTSVL